MSNIININQEKQSVKNVIDQISDSKVKSIMCVYTTDDEQIHCLGSNMNILEIIGALDAAKMHIWEDSAE